VLPIEIVLGIAVLVFALATIIANIIDYIREHMVIGGYYYFELLPECGEYILVKSRCHSSGYRYNVRKLLQVPDGMPPVILDTTFSRFPFRVDRITDVSLIMKLKLQGLT